MFLSSPDGKDGCSVGIPGWPLIESAEYPVLIPTVIIIARMQPGVENSKEEPREQ